MGTVTIYPSLFLLRSMLMCIVSGKMGLRSRPSLMNKNVWRIGRFVIIIWLFCLFSIKKYTEIPFFCLKKTNLQEINYLCSILMTENN